MEKIERLGLGTMSMHLRNKETSIETIRTALQSGMTLLNTGEFYNGSESEMVLGEALKGIDRNSYFLSVKFGVLPDPKGGIYGLDVRPFNIRGHLTYSLKRLGLDYIDLYQPARMDTTIPVEEIMKEMVQLKEEGLIKYIGLSEVDAETLRRACAVHPVHTVEVEYSLIERRIEKELIETAQELGVKVLAYGAVGHGLLTEKVLDMKPNPQIRRGIMAPENSEHNISLVRELKKIADEKQVSVSQLALAWTLAKYPHVQALVGTTNPEHLLESMEALKIELTKDEIEKIEKTISPEMIKGKTSRHFVFTDGKASIQ